MIKLIDILIESALKEKKDRCHRIADRRYDKPSAYKSGAIVRCRQGKIWKKLKEDQSFQKAIIYPNFQGVDFADNVDGEVKIIKVNDCIGNEPGKDFNYFNTEKKDYVEKMIKSAKEQGIKSFPPIKALKHPLLSGKYIVVDGNHRLGAFKIGNIPEIKASILDEDDIVLAIPGTKWQEGKIPETISLKDAKSKGIDLKNYFNTKELNIPTSSLANKLTEDESLRKWFGRRGAAGKEGGWVDCNTCREVDGKTKCKPCGRKEGEKRAKYPSCRPTPAGCKKKGKGKTWGKTK